ncbi:hypothetical protein LTR36_009736 [Oleoguttula mirabilis]|uniref:Uncharacterized protein n=1 Tax=Oleoguttula mirabilis TaxID=1507867 RepID=A0AAV9J652_9PEZI|nr:hypothetical protein LTR36_009736 [Oleoguttula mirabilis]
MEVLRRVLRFCRLTKEAAPSQPPKKCILFMLPAEIRNKIFEDVFEIEDYGTRGPDRLRALELLFPNPDDLVRDPSRAIIGRFEQLRSFNERSDLCWLGQINLDPLFTCKQLYNELRPFAYNMRGLDYVRFERLHYRDAKHDARAVSDRLGTVLWWPTDEADYQTHLSATRIRCHHLWGATATPEKYISVSDMWQLIHGQAASLVVLPDPAPAAGQAVASPTPASWDVLSNWNRTKQDWSVDWPAMRVTARGNLLLASWAPRHGVDGRAAAYTHLHYRGHGLVYNMRTREVITCSVHWRDFKDFVAASSPGDTAALVGNMSFVQRWIDMLIQDVDPGRGDAVGPAPRLPRRINDCLQDD